jgi:hypothetical protein
MKVFYLFFDFFYDIIKFMIVGEFLWTIYILQEITQHIAKD